MQVLILWVYRGFISTRATNSERVTMICTKSSSMVFTTQARCLPNQYQPFENVAIYLEMHGSPDLHRVYHVFEIFNGCTVICSILASKTPNERIIFVRLGVLFLTMWVLGTDLYPTGCTPSLLLISLNPATKFGLIFLFFDNLHHSSS